MRWFEERLARAIGWRSIPDDSMVSSGCDLGDLHESICDMVGSRVALECVERLRAFWVPDRDGPLDGESLLALVQAGLFDTFEQDEHSDCRGGSEGMGDLECEACETEEDEDEHDEELSGDRVSLDDAHGNCHANVAVRRACLLSISNDRASDNDVSAAEYSAEEAVIAWSGEVLERALLEPTARAAAMLVWSKFASIEARVTRTSRKDLEMGLATRSSPHMVIHHSENLFRRTCECW